MNSRANITEKRHGGSPVRRLVLVFALAALVGAALLALSGCKYSDVLTQHLEDPVFGALDETQDPIYTSNPEVDLEIDLDDISIGNSDDINTQTATMPHYDPNAPDNGPTTQFRHSDETPHDDPVSETDDQEDEESTESGDDGDSTSDDSTGKDGAGGGNNDDDDSDDDDSDDDDPNQDPGQNDDDPLRDDDATTPQDPGTGGPGDGDPLVGDGTQTESAKGTIAAVGEYATIAQMLGGAGGLVACDEEWMQAREADGCFKGELDSVKVVFSGDGAEEGSCDVDALIEAHPEVVLCDGVAPVLSDAERARLEDEGITVQQVPRIGEQTTEDYTVIQAATEVAEVLSGASGLGEDPEAMLSDYINYHDSILSQAYSLNGGYSFKATDSSYEQLYQATPLDGLSNSTTTRAITVYVDTMKKFGSKATVAQTATTSSGPKTLFHDGMKLDVSDGVAMSAKTGAHAYMLIDYYLQLAGIMNNAYDTAQPEASGKRYILMPGSTADFGASDNYASRQTGTAFFFNSGDATVYGNWHALGEEGFKWVLTGDEDTADAIIASAKKKDGLYRMKDSYQVAVVPSGISGSWTCGHVDSFLLSTWAFRMRGDNLDDAAVVVDDFYAGFLRCDSWEAAVSDWDYAKTAENG